MAKKEKMFVGIDPSFNSTGIIILDNDGKIVEQMNFSLKEFEKIEEKLIQFEKTISFIPKMIRLESVYIEGPSYMSSGQYVLQMGALHYLLRLFLYRHNINYKVIAPGTLKKFVTGKGNAKKDLILLKVYKRWGVEFEIDDLADAYGLARMALDDYINK